MSTRRVHLLASAGVLLGVVVWLLDAVADYLLFHRGAFLDLLIIDVPPRAWLMRALILAICVGLCTFAGRLDERRRRQLQQSERRLREILDSMDALVYVADMQSYEVLFVNSPLRRQLDAEDLVGRKCWQVLQAGQSGPCSFCTNHLLVDDQGRPTGVHPWELRNPHSQRWYDLRDQAIEWTDGRLVRLEIATDVTDRKLAEQAIRTLAETTRDHADGSFMRDSLRSLAELYGTRYAFVSVYSDETHTRLQPLAFLDGGELIDASDYPVPGTPCEGVMTTDVELVTEGAWRRYPEDTLLKELGVESYLGAPLAGAEGIRGVLAVMDTRALRPAVWSRSVLGTFASRIALELRRQDLEQVLLRRGTILRTVSEIAGALLLQTESVEAFDHALRRLGEAAAASRVALVVNVTDEHERLAMRELSTWEAPGAPPRPEHGEQPLPYSRGHTRLRQTLEAGQVFQARLHTLPEEEQAVFQSRSVASMIAVPLVLDEGRWHGYLGFEDCLRERTWSEEEVDALHAAAALIGAALTRRNAEKELRLAASVYQHSLEGIMITDLRGRIERVNPAFTRITGYPPEEVIGRSASLLKSGRHDQAYYARMGESLDKNGAWQGEIWSRHRDGETYPQWLTISAVRDEHGAVARYIGMIADLSLIKQQTEKLEHMAHHHPLTGLPNRLLLMARLSHSMQLARREGHSVAVLFLDLDQFKRVNDAFGHAVGDQVLQHIADRLLRQLREEDTLAHLGGDEFVVVMEHVRGSDDVALVAQKLLRTLALPLMIEGRELYVGGSIGICVYPRDGTDVELLLKRADAAMYRAKERGRNNYQFYTEELTRQALERVMLEAGLRRGLETGELVVHYQPVVHLSSGRLVGVEALLRWQHPDMGLLGPADFLATAEECGLIVDIGAQVLETSCAQLGAWRQAGLSLEWVSVNISPVQLLHGDLPATVARVLERTGCPASALELEMSETALMREAEAATDVFDRLARLGVGLAVDDFGTGCSFLGLLRQLPVTRLKVDERLVRDTRQDLRPRSLAAAAVQLGHALGLKVSAEGVATAEQRRVLAAAGCEEAQGHLFSRPLPAAELAELALEWDSERR